MHAHTPTHTQGYTHTHTYALTHNYTHTHTHMHSHITTHTHTHTHKTHVPHDRAIQTYSEGFKSAGQFYVRIVMIPGC